jgi:hypothetical protein
MTSHNNPFVRLAAKIVGALEHPDEPTIADRGQAFKADLQDHINVITKRYRGIPVKIVSIKIDDSQGDGIITLQGGGLDEPWVIPFNTNENLTDFLEEIAEHLPGIDVNSLNVFERGLSEDRMVTRL